MKVKELQKTVNIAWSPLPQNPIYLAAGTAAQPLDSSGNSTLEIYSTNFSDPSYDLELKASLPSQYRFQKVIWSPTGYNAAHRNGLIVGGCEGGHVTIYSAAKMLAGEEGLIERQHKHSGPVTGLDFNPFQTNLLASCASESEIFIWDLNNTSTHMTPGTKTLPAEDVQNVAWNRQVQHILASVFSSRCVIWDLRKSEQIIKLSDMQSRVRWHAIQWHPEAATQVWLASEDNQAPVVQLWDLRYATAPAKTMQIHQSGVLGMSWCPRDTDLMVSCGKDNRIYCWNPNTELPEGEILSEVANTATCYSDVQWCPRNPALVASSSLDGNVSIYSLFGGTQQQVQTANKIADSFPGMDQFAQAPMPQQSAQIVYHDLKRAPKWIKRPCGVAFGFGGQLINFNAKSKTINISQVITEPDLVERANALERSLAESNLAEYCRQRADQKTGDQNGRSLWYFIKANFELSPKEEMLNLLGYNKDDIDSKFASYIKEDEQTQNDVDQLTNRISNLTHQPVDNNAIFDGIAAAHKQQENEADLKQTQFKIPRGDHVDSLITEALLSGNLEAAVELCIESKRPAEALIIASTAGIEFLTHTQNRYLKEQQQSSELSQVISALVTRDWMDFVSRCTVDSWKEALVAALKHSDRKVVDICERLGDRLLSEAPSNAEYTHNAMLCYVCAGSIDKLLAAWYQLKQLEHPAENANYKLNTDELQELAEVVMLMSKSLMQQGIALDLSERFSDFLSEYSGLLASQGALTAALEYIFALRPDSSDEHTQLDELRERIYKTVNYKKTPATAQASRSAYNQQQNVYGRQQQQPPQQLQHQQQSRGSFSHPQSLGGYPSTAATNPLLPQQQQFQTNAWNAPPSAAAAVQPPQAPLVPTMFNPAQPIAASVKPPQMSNDTYAPQQPARPLSTASSQGGGGAGSTTGGSLLSRSKYVLDPSVAPAAPLGYGAPYNPAASMVPSMAPAAAGVPMQAPNSFNPNAFNVSGGASAIGGVGIPQQQQQPTLMQPSYNAAPFGAPVNSYMPGVPPIETSQQQGIPPPPLQNIQRNPTPPPGWNDPPALKSARASKKSDSAGPAAPITHPLFGVDPNQNQNGYMDPNAHYQNSSMPGMPPPPSTGGMVNSYLNPAASTQIPQNNNQPQTTTTQQFPQQMNFQASAIQTPQHQQQWNTQAPNVGYTEQPATIQRQPEPPKEKPPLPEEYMYLQTVLEELKQQCLNSAADARTKRKFVDVAKRLENLYDCLRDGRLTPATIAALNQIVQCIQCGNYGNATQLQTQIAFGSDFSQCAGFMPGLKVLVQSAADLQVYLQ